MSMHKHIFIGKRGFLSLHSNIYNWHIIGVNIHLNGLIRIEINLLFLSMALGYVFKSKHVNGNN